MKGNEQFAIGTLVRCKNTGFTGVVRMRVFGEGFEQALVSEGPIMFDNVTFIKISDLERFGVTDASGVKNDFKTMPKGESTKQNPAECLSSDDKESIKVALLLAAVEGHLTNMTAYGLIDQFRQVDAA